MTDQTQFDFSAPKKEQAPAKSNIPEYSVSDLSFSLKRTLEDTYGHVRVRGELSQVKIHTSGHMYSSLKDDQAVISTVCWRGTVSKLSIKPEEGLEVICTGRVSTYPARSNYQLIIESMELAGEGALLKMLEERKKKLAAEGLFDPARKKTLPFLPQKIGVITSQTGAVIRDILHRLKDRFPAPVILWPVLVQGDGAAEQVTNALQGMNTLEEKPDLIILARGGGSLEDLMAFNEEIVVRAIAESGIPVISAIGHETDTTLSDYAADLRAPTPTGAAEMAVPERAALMAQILENSNRIDTAIMRRFSDFKNLLEARSARLLSPKSVIEMKTQKLDHMTGLMDRYFERLISTKEKQITTLSAKLKDPKSVFESAEDNLQKTSSRFTALGPRLLERFEKDLAQSARMLETLSFKRVLDRGFVVVRDEKGQPITQADRLNTGDFVDLQFKEDQKRSAKIQ